MNDQIHMLCRSFSDSSAIPVTYYLNNEANVILPGFFGTRLTSLYLADREAVLSSFSDRSLLAIQYDRKNQLWCMLRDNTCRILTGPVQTGSCLNYPYRGIREYSESGFVSVNLDLLDALKEEDSSRFFKKDLERKSFEYINDPEESGEVLYHYEVLYAMISGNLRALDAAIKNTQIQQYLLSMMPDRESAEHMYISTMSQWLFLAREYIPPSKVKSMYQRYFADLSRCSDIPSILSSIFGIMHDVTKLVSIQKNQNKSYEYRMICAYIEDHISEPIEIEKIAEHLGVSSSSIQHKIKKETGTSITKLIHSIRTEKACFYISSTNLSFSEIAYRLGFSSQSHFINVFRQNMGKTPGQYREEQKGLTADELENILQLSAL